MTAKLRGVVIALAGYALLGGAVSLAGWMLDLQRLTDWDGNGISIQPNTAIAVIAAAAGLILLGLGYRSGAQVLGAITGVIGASVLLEMITGVDLGVDSRLLFGRDWGGVGVLMPGRMGPPGAVSWTLIGLAIVFAARGAKARAIVPWLATTTLLISSVPLIGYLYGAQLLYTLPRLTVVALQTGTFIFAVSSALLLSVPERFPVRGMIEDGAAGVLVRRALPIVVVLPIVLGFLRLLGGRAGLYDIAFGAALRTVAEIVLLVVLLAWTSGELRRHQRRAAAERISSEESLRASRLQLQADLGAMTKLHTLATQLAPTGDRDALLEQVLAVAGELLATDKGNIQLYDREEARLVLAVHRGYGPRFVERFAQSGCPEVCDAAAGSFERVLVEDVETDARLAGSIDREILLDDGIRTILSTPLLSRNGRLLGVLNNQFRRPHRPNEQQLRYLDLLARMSADVIERSRIEHALMESEHSERLARAEAERANATKDEFLATLSHELRSPLNAIVGWVHILERRPDDPELLREGIEVIARNAKAQHELIADLLDMNRIISGKIRLDVEDVALSALVAESIETVRPAAESKSIELSMAAETPDEVVRVDAARLSQVLSNLLSNAVKFTPRGGRIEVLSRQSDTEAQIVVRDTGAGIAPALLPHVFDRFRQGDASTTRAHGGLGLGLAIAKQLIELHGGRLLAESEGDGLGATFTIALPRRARSTGRRLGPGRPIDASSRDEDLSFEGITALIVEDQPDARHLLRVVLESRNATVLTAASTTEALGLLERQKPDIILCDVGMPGRDGYELIGEVRRKHDATPAVAVTAFAGAEDKIRALRAGFDAHVSKPVDAAKLLDTVSVFIRARRPAQGTA